MRLRIYLRREAYVWVSLRGQQDVNFGWILGYRQGGEVIFKAEHAPRAVGIAVREIESCGAV
jgi:hypothetical protein